MQFILAFPSIFIRSVPTASQTFGLRSQPNPISFRARSNDESHRLKRFVADLSLEEEITEDGDCKKRVELVAGQEDVRWQRERALFGESATRLRAAADRGGEARDSQMRVSRVPGGRTDGETQDKKTLGRRAC
jgi:hypothetical protein